MPATNGNDLLIGNANPNNIEGLGGDDEIYGRGGNDFLDGDSVGGATGDDEIYGEGGDDDLFGRDGNDELRGGQGEDYLDGWGGNDELYGGKHEDHLTGLSGNDWLVGGEGGQLHVRRHWGRHLRLREDQRLHPLRRRDRGFRRCRQVDVSGIDASPASAATRHSRSRGWVVHSGPGSSWVTQDSGNTYVYLNNDADVARPRVLQSSTDCTTSTARTSSSERCADPAPSAGRRPCLDPPGRPGARVTATPGRFGAAPRGTDGCTGFPIGA